MGIQSRAERRAADGKGMDGRQRGAQRRFGKGELGRVAAELLAKGERRGVLQVRAADLEDTGECRRLGLQGRAQPRERCQQRSRLQHSGDVHGRREDIVRGLAEVDVVVWMHATRRSEPPAECERCQVGDHLVDVHVALSAGTGLPDGQRKLCLELAGRDARRSRGHGVGLGGVEQAERAIDLRRGTFDLGQRVHDLHRHALSSNREETAAALGLRPP